MGGCHGIRFIMSRLTTEFIDSCAKELGSKRHRVELPWERRGLKEVLNPPSFPELKIPAPVWVDVPTASSKDIPPTDPQSLSVLCLSSMLERSCLK